MSDALKTDLYQLTMAAGYWRAELTSPATYELFVRRLPERRAFLIVAGVDSALDRVFEGMVEAFLPDRAGKDSAVIQWDLMTPDGPRTYQLVVENAKCRYQRDSLDQPRVSLKIALPDFLRLITGKLSGLQAFFQGKLKVGGDVLFAQQQEKWFQKPS